MPRTHVVFYQEDDDVCPVLEWLDGLQPRFRDKCVVRIERLAELGHDLRRPEADFLRDGIHELRIRFGHVNYRLLYFFHGRTVAVLVHGLVKEQAVPPRDITLAITRKNQFIANPAQHTYEE